RDDGGTAELEVHQAIIDGARGRVERSTGAPQRGIEAFRRAFRAVDELLRISTAAKQGGQRRCREQGFHQFHDVVSPEDYSAPGIPAPSLGRNKAFFLMSRNRNNRPAGP